MSEATRDRLLAAAKRQFADKGFYGASLAQIADELGITKQALLYHFRRKEDLYAEVLAQISDRLLRYVRMAGNEGVDPARQLEHIALAIHYAAAENPEDSRLLMRELLDNQSRADQAKTWYLVPFLDGLVAVVKAVPGLERAGDTAIFCFVYQLLGGIEYFAISTATLRRMYGDDTYETVRDHFPLELQDHIHRFLESVAGG
jgi:AcrR family transcriptional regulator